MATDTSARSRDEKAYVRGIEKPFLALRGGGLCVSPRDFALLTDWFERGVPALLVIEAISRVFARAASHTSSRRVNSIAYCRRAVEEAWARVREGRPAVPQRAGVKRPTLDVSEVASHLEASAETLRKLARAPQRAGNAASPPHAARTRLAAVGERLAGIASSLDPRSPLDFAALEGDLARLEQAMHEAAEGILGPDEVARLVDAAKERIEPFSAKMSARARATTLRRSVEAAMRETLGLPRLSLFTLSG